MTMLMRREYQVQSVRVDTDGEYFDTYTMEQDRVVLYHFKVTVKKEHLQILVEHFSRRADYDYVLVYRKITHHMKVWCASQRNVQLCQEDIVRIDRTRGMGVPEYVVVQKDHPAVKSTRVEDMAMIRLSDPLVQYMGYKPGAILWCPYMNLLRVVVGD